ncbi:hypothetical protein RDI58_000617 [Solanum bulbocastanum]|uniref:Uncharacterized protein n=1 Tax=Solanum bulbocastanum TaxID=147425 RepID=A0AAN8U7S3_SOLBU
MGVGITKP